MRIVAGTYRGRHFEVPRSFKARPTTDFAKENLFNVLRSYFDFEDEAPSALDLFAGTGSITLELLSRGCSHVTSVELDAQHLALIRRFVNVLDESSRVTLIRADVLRFLRKVSGPFDFIFADPPYALPELEQLPNLIFPDDFPPLATDERQAPASSPFLTPSGLFVLEHGKSQDFSSHPHFLEHRSYGSVNFSFFR